MEFRVFQEKIDRLVKESGESAKVLRYENDQDKGLYIARFSNGLNIAQAYNGLKATFWYDETYRAKPPKQGIMAVL